MIKFVKLLNSRAILVIKVGGVFLGDIFIMELSKDKEDCTMNLGYSLFHARKKRGLSQKKLPKRLG